MSVKSKVLISLTMLLLLLDGVDAMAQKARSTSIVTIGGESFYVHTVTAGETLYSLSKLYSISEEDILKANPQVVDGLKLDQVLKIRTIAAESNDKKISDRKMSKLFDQHMVNKGETAYSICKRYGLSLTTLIEDNLGLDPSALALGQKLNIRKNSVGDSEPNKIQTQLEDYRDATNSVATDFKLHLVEKGETIYSLSKHYDVAKDELTALNNIMDGLKAGMMIKIPVKQVPALPLEPAITVDEQVETSAIIVREFKKGETINVAMMLPLQTGASTNKSFLEFYQGALIALEDLKTDGVNVELDLYNTERSASAVTAIVDGGGFGKTDLIIGPIYEESYAPVVEFADKHGVALVSPLATMERVQSPMLYQLSPDPQNKYAKLKNSLSENKNVVLVSMASNDADFEREIKDQLPAGYRRFNYSKSSLVTDLEALISGEKENVFVVLSSNESAVDEFLARISSVQNNLLARSIKSESIKIIGTSRWLRFQNIDKNLYFKLGLSFVTSYHADRSSRVVMSFDKRYIAAFGALPSLYSYRGYDAVKLFVGNLAQGYDGNDLSLKINDSTIELLQMPYRFTQNSRRANHVNKEWGLVTYKSDYTIEVW